MELARRFITSSIGFLIRRSSHVISIGSQNPLGNKRPQSLFLFPAVWNFLVRLGKVCTPGQRSFSFVTSRQPNNPKRNKRDGPEGEGCASWFEQTHVRFPVSFPTLFQDIPPFFPSFLYNSSAGTRKGNPTHTQSQPAQLFSFTFSGLITWSNDHFR